MPGRDGMTYLTSLGLKELLAQGDASSSTAGTNGQALLSGGASGPVRWGTLGTATISVASTSTAGIVSTGIQSFAGTKTFKATVNLQGQVNLQPTGTSLVLGLNTGVYSPGTTTITMTNAPSQISGDPSTYLRIIRNGVNLVIPAWTAT